MSTPTVPETTSVAPAALAHLFRHSLRDGRVHPLLHLVWRYRQESAQ